MAAICGRSSTGIDDTEESLQSLWTVVAILRSSVSSEEGNPLSKDWWRPRLLVTPARYGQISYRQLIFHPPHEHRHRRIWVGILQISQNGLLTNFARLNLTAESHVDILEPQWNPSVESQAIGRVSQLGQEKAATVTRHIIRRTVEVIPSFIVWKDEDMITC